MPGAGRPSRRAPGPRETECEPRGHRAVPPLTRAGTLHKAPTAPAPCGLSAGRQRGLRSHTPATQGERKINSSHLTGAEELGGSWHCLGFPSCKHRQRKRRSTRSAPYEHRDPEVRTEAAGAGCLLAPRPASLSSSDWLALSLSPAREEEPAGGRARRWTVSLATAAGCHAQPSANVFPVDSAWELCSGLSGTLPPPA